MVLAELKLHRFYQLVVSTHRILVTILSKLHDLIYFGQRENPPCVLERHRFVFVVVFFVCRLVQCRRCCCCCYAIKFAVIYVLRHRLSQVRAIKFEISKQTKNVMKYFTMLGFFLCTFVKYITDHV